MREKLLLHPFLSFATRPGVRLLDEIPKERIRRLNGPEPADPSTDWLRTTSNNHGFFSPFDYPVLDRDRSSHFVLGVFGGSVASWFVLQAGRSLAARLEGTMAASRTAVVLNFASGGYKQPQPLYALQYFLAVGQPFDAILLIDGFNEAALSWDNLGRGVHPSMASQAYLEVFAPEMAHALILRSGEPGDPDEDIALLWYRSSRMMHEVCRTFGIGFAHLLQPNQYFGGKRFSRQEEEIALSSTSPYRRPVGRVYPRLQRLGRVLIEDGVRFVDATGLFDPVQETTYSDNCCHYNRLGNSLLEHCAHQALSTAVSG